MRGLFNLQGMAMDTKQPSGHNTAQIRDLGLATALVSLNHDLYGTERTKSGRVYFVFSDTPALRNMTKAYWDNSLNVDARTYSEVFKTLKNLIYSERF